MPKKRKEAPEVDLIHTCAHCGHIVHPGRDGGKATIGYVISGLPTRTIWLHNACLNAYMEDIEERRRPFSEHTFFENGMRRDVGR